MKYFTKINCLAVLILFSSLSVAQIYIIDEDFSGWTGTATQNGWTQTMVSGDAGCDDWHFDNPGSVTGFIPPIVSPFAIFDGEWACNTCGPCLNAEIIYLTSPAFDASYLGDPVNLMWDQFYNLTGFDEISVEVYDGATWNNIVYNNSTSTGGSPVQDSQSFNIFSIVNGVSNAQVRFRYEGDDDLYWIIDNVKIEAIFQANISDISGKIFNDFNADCIQDTGEFLLSNWLIKAEPGPYYGYTNANGFYKIYVDTGQYTISLILQNSLWQQNCPVSPDYYIVNITSANDTISNINFGVQVDVYCPILSVDISTFAILPCFTSYYSVSYCNNGTAPADNATIEVELDDNMTYASGTGNLISQIGNILTFDIGTVNPGQCGSFYLYIDVLCDMSLVGQTMCVEAHIYPDSTCFPADPTWDHSSVAVEGSCVGDSLACFTIYNTGDAGTGDMDGTSEYRIYENNILVYTGTFQITGGDSLVICWPANGNTIRLEADQRPGHPGNSHPQDNVEMCGDSTQTFVTGEITVIPEDDEDYFVEIDCHVATGSYDPNDKQVKPEGLNETYHFIDSTDVLEYVIHFQNTGTATALNIVIYDTLSAYLDITTIEPGASSHTYALNIIGSNILEWKFDNIMLPDSNVNEPASNGFVKFKIHQTPGNTKGTVIENNAGIIFDFNVPVITNIVFNTVGNIDSITQNVPIIYDESISVKVYPNPFSSTTTFEIQGMNQPLTFELYNIIGEQVMAISNITKDKFIISRKNLSNGIYIYKISTNDKLICAGKLVVN